MGTGLFGPFALNFTASSKTQRLRATRTSVPALTTDMAGPGAVVSVVGWVKRPAGNSRNNSYGFLASALSEAH